MGLRSTQVDQRRAAQADQFAGSYKAVAQVVRELGLLRRARWFYGLLFGGLCLALAGTVAGFVLLGDSWWQLLIAATLGVICTQFAFLAHEASHRQIFSGGPANDRAGRLLGTLLVGISYSWWMGKHTRHHANPNRVGKDPDIEIDTISFLAEDAATRRGLLAALTRRQGYAFFPLLMLEGINLHVSSIRFLAGRRRITGRWVELGLIAAHLALIATPAFVFLSPGIAGAFCGVQLAVFGVYMGASFAPNHKGMPIVGADEKLDFFTKQVRTSRNIRGRFWASALMGGLNYQVEHHLFPSMPRPHLAKARSIVRDYCRSRGIPYTETSLPRSYAIVIAYLNEVGLAARDPFECPMLALRR
ncbi:fatty acid desaturase [Actinocatenispora comari]|uniref:Fatty acid desaturase n=1 Tax=Actinocatenispora comari TaxID=2807577 RepID=A0A8J4A6C8_9ACTN|nr:fatty acid desaturase [Actinocatenispora comari]